MQPSRDIRRLIELMAALRTPGTGCPWDLQQSFETIAPYTIEEAYEVADAINRRDLPGLTDELGDLLLQVVFHARMAEEQGAFDFGDVVHAITSKLIRRHPHVFGDTGSLSPEEVKGLWQKIKDEERSKKKSGEGAESILDGITLALPALDRAEKLTRRAATVGFDWPDVPQTRAKIEEELQETIAAENDPKAAAEEIGDLLFAVVNYARKLNVDPESALRATNDKFMRRFRAVEDALRARGKTPRESDLAEMDALWNEAKAAERKG
ncbi:MAG TPA: nucleoside triphosphate pyrophosphohydrolase [Xanthobacteraceae bacterium]|nr:nucleoside triphosphate pyrophosphohydrolase [Xanthobacteraceae bacterium]